VPVASTVVYDESIYEGKVSSPGRFSRPLNLKDLLIFDPDLISLSPRLFTMKLFESVKLLSLLVAAQATAFPIIEIAAPSLTDSSDSDSHNNTESNSHSPSSQTTAYSNNWSGVVLSQPPSGDEFTHVSTMFTIPKVSSDGLDSYQSASVWVGIDGATVSDAILQTGVDVGIRDGSPLYTAWYQWYPETSVTWPDFELQAGDVIMATVNATSKTSGICIVENKSTGQKATKTLESPNPSSTLSGQNAEWIVEDFLSNGSPVPLVDFGEVTFEESRAETKKGKSVGVSGATPYVMVIDDEQVTEVDTVNDSRFKVKHT